MHIFLQAVTIQLAMRWLINIETLLAAAYYNLPIMNITGYWANILTPYEQ